MGCDQRHAVWPLFLKAHSLLAERLDSELSAECGMPLTWFDVLVRLADAPDGRLRMQDLSETVLLSKSGVTRLADRMEAAGLIARGPCPTDRRVVFVVITTRGRAAFDRAAPVAFRGVQEHFARHLRPHEEAALRDFLERVLVSLAGGMPRARAARRAD